MKICDLTQSYASTGGGIRTYIHAKRAYIETHMDAEHLLIVPGERDSVTERGRTTTYTVASPPVPGSAAYRLLLRSDKVLKILNRERPDVIEALCGYNLPWTALRYRRDHPASAVVGGYRTDFPTCYVEAGVRAAFGKAAGRKARALGYRYARALYRRCDAVYALSPTFVHRLADAGIPSVELLPLGVDLATFHPTRRDAAVRARFGVGDHEPLLVYGGRLDREKRPMEVVDAFEQLPVSLGAALVLLGDGPLRADLEARAARNSRLHVLGFESNRDAYARLLASADVYVSAMPHETFGQTVVEAQASGLAVVGVQAGAMVDRVPESLGRLGPVGDTSAMAINIIAVLADGHRATGERARAFVETLYSWDATFEQLFDLYERAIWSRRCAPATTGHGTSRVTPPRTSDDLVPS